MTRPSRAVLAFLSTACALALPTIPAHALPAFPGAEGFGANALGGRGGDVYHVTSLADTNTPGTLRYGISSAPATGRTIVFDVSGTIALNSNLSVNKPKITIAGQTAPGQGISFRDYTFNVNASDVVVRYIHSRLGTAKLQESDTIDITGGTNVILDHVSASWSVDETLSVSNSANNVTVQYSYITESLNNSIHSKGAHGYGSLIRPEVNSNISFNHNLYADHNSRNPRPGTYNGSTLNFDFRNNVVYNWGSQAGYNSDLDPDPELVHLNYAGNYLVAGPSTPTSKAGNAFQGGAASANPEHTTVYQSDNRIDPNKNLALDGTDTGWSMFNGTYLKALTPFPTGTVTTDAPDVAYAKVLASAGAFPYNRDPVDARVTQQLINHTGAIIDTTDQVGGYPTLPAVTRPANFDSDRDGMPDAWETTRGLNPALADNNALAPNGYTNLETYLNALTLIANWNADANGNWSDYLKWAGTRPELTDATANFGPTISAPRTITVGSGVSVGQLNLDSPVPYTLAGAGTISLDVLTGRAVLAVSRGGHTVSAPLSPSDDTDVSIAAGAALTVTDLRQTTATIRKLDAGTLTVNRVRAGTLSIQSGKLAITPNGTASGSSTVSTLTLADGATLDLADNALTIAYGTAPSPLAPLTARVAHAYHLGRWDDTGLTTSLPTGGTHALGLLDTGSQLLIQYTWTGDTNLDGAVNETDLAALIAGTQRAPGSATWQDGDLNYDGTVNPDDFALFQLGSTAYTTALTHTPEPTAVAFAAIPLILIPRRRRQGA